MNGNDYLKMLVEDIHSTTVATIGSDGHPQTRVIEKHPYMQDIYPGDTRSALEVFHLSEASGEYFDISDPAHVTRDSIVIGQPEAVASGYFVGDKCIGCKLCYSVCPQKCIDISSKPVVIDQSRCLHCGHCAEICPKQTIEKRG
ncbi:MAG: 4Fe-4S binding protein [Oscillospiraceae bacterium]|nr:4Fe-4S binding protein [Oscillospiraceae bacterium]